MPDLLVNAITTLFSLGLALLFGMSLSVWVRVLRHVRRHTPLRLPYEWESALVPQAETDGGDQAGLDVPLALPEPSRLPPFQILSPAALIALLWVGVAFTSQFGAPAERETNPPPEKLRTMLLLTAAESCLVLGLCGFALAMPILAEKSPLLQSQCGFSSRDAVGQFLTGLVGFVASLVPVFLVMLLTFPLRSQETLHPFLKLLQGDLPAVDLCLVLLTAVVLAPLKEELLFRVLLQTLAEYVLAPRLAIIITALLFAAIHRFPDSLAIIPLGLILGYVFQRTRSFLAVVTLHACFNAFNTVYLLLSVWSQELPALNP